MAVEVGDAAVLAHQRQRRVFATTVLGNICDYVRKTNTSIVRVFSRMDADGSGDLDVIELQAALLKMGQDLSELEVEEDPELEPDLEVE